MQQLRSRKLCNDTRRNLIPDLYIDKGKKKQKYARMPKDKSSRSPSTITQWLTGIQAVKDLSPFKGIHLRNLQRRGKRNKYGTYKSNTIFYSNTLYVSILFRSKHYIYIYSTLLEHPCYAVKVFWRLELNENKYSWLLKIWKIFIELKDTLRSTQWFFDWQNDFKDVDQKLNRVGTFSNIRSRLHYFHRANRSKYWMAMKSASKPCHHVNLPSGFSLWYIYLKFSHVIQYHNR